jgi:hypothetical protein
MELKEALFIVLAFLFPLWVYCLFLAVLNRRSHPVVVAGPWDFLGVVLALSGFLVVGGPAILSNLATSVHGRRPTADDPPGASPRQVLLGAVLVMYFALLIASLGVMLRRRRDMTSVYNVEPGVFDEVFGQVLDQLGLSWTRAGNLYYLGARPSQPAAAREPNPQGVTAAGAIVPAAPLPSPVWEESSVIEVEPFPPLYHVTIRWGDVAPETHQEVEGELTRALAAVRTRGNPVGGWFLSAAAMLFLVMGAVLLLLLAAKALLRA